MEMSVEVQSFRISGLYSRKMQFENHFIIFLQHFDHSQNLPQYSIANGLLIILIISFATLIILFQNHFLFVPFFHFSFTFFLYGGVPSSSRPLQKVIFHTS